MDTYSTVARRARSMKPSDHHQIHRRSIKHKRLNRIVYVYSEPSQSASSIASTTLHNLHKSAVVRSKASEIQTRVLKYSRNTSPTVLLTSCSTKTTAISEFDRKGVVKEHHRPLEQKKKRCSGVCITCTVLIVALLLSVTLTAILLGVLIKPQTTTTLAPNPLLRWNKEGVTIAGSGVAGNSNDQLNQPRDAIRAAPNRVYIADYANHRIQKYSIGTSTGSTIAGQTNGISGNLSNYLGHPSRVLVDSNDAIYVADSDNHRIQFWSNGGSSGVTIAGSSAGISGSSNSQLHTPVGLALDSRSNTLYITDFYNDRVMCYSSGAASGTVVAGGNGFGLNHTQLWRPSGLYFDSFTNSLIIANSNAQNIVRWVLGASSWSLLGGSTNAISGNNAMLLRYPIDVTLDPMGNIYIADRNNHRIQLLMVGQTEAITIAGVSNLSGTNASLLNTPYAVRLDDQLNLYVADSQNHRIQMFSRY